MTTSGGAPARPARRRLGGLIAAVGLAALVALVHGPAVPTGWFMDDHVHVQQLRESGWSLRGLTDACRLDLVGERTALWWLPACTLRFCRPVAFGVMKLTYTLTGWSPEAMHVASLGWHMAVCLLLVRLLGRCGLGGWPAWAAAALFAIHPAHVATVQWIACQTELMVTALLLGATLCYARWRGWGDRGEPVAGAGWLVASVALFALACGCRENAILLPVILWCMEGFSRKRSRAEVLIGYAAMAATIVAYLSVRTALLGGVAVPPKPYVVSPADPEFLRYVGDKGLYYLLGQFLLIPCVPIAGLPFLRDWPAILYGLGGVLVVVLVATAWLGRRRPAARLGPAWLIAFTLPVLPVFEAPHHLYLPGIGWAIIVAFVLRLIAPNRSASNDAAAVVGRRAAAAACLVLLSGLVLGRVSTWLGLTIRTGQEVETGLVEELASPRSGLHDGDTLYVLNLPLVGHYADLALEQRTGRRGVRVVPLTWATRVLGMATPAELSWVDDRTVEVRAAGDAYFAGPLGRLVRQVNCAAIPDVVDETGRLGVRVEVLERAADGLSALRFRFSRPLNDPAVHLFWGSRARWACEVRPPPGVTSDQPR